MDAIHAQARKFVGLIREGRSGELPEGFLPPDDWTGDDGCSWSLDAAISLRTFKRIDHKRWCRNHDWAYQARGWWSAPGNRSRDKRTLADRMLSEGMSSDGYLFLHRIYFRVLDAVGGGAWNKKERKMIKHIRTKALVAIVSLFLLGGCGGGVGELLGGAALGIAGNALYDTASAGQRVVAEDLAAKARWKTQHDTRTIKAIDACEDFVEDVQDKMGETLLAGAIIDVAKVKEIINLSFLCLDKSVENQPDLAIERVIKGIRRARAPAPPPAALLPK